MTIKVHRIIQWALVIFASGTAITHGVRDFMEKVGPDADLAKAEVWLTVGAGALWTIVPSVIQKIAAIKAHYSNPDGAHASLPWREPPQ